MEAYIFTGMTMNVVQHTCIRLIMGFWKFRV